MILSINHTGGRLHPVFEMKRTLVVFVVVEGQGGILP